MRSEFTPQTVPPEAHDPARARAAFAGWPGEVQWRYSVAELWADGVIHVLGLLLAVGGVVGFVATMPAASGTYRTAVAIYLATLVFLIAASATYNIWPVSRFKWMLRRLDHSAIYLLIAGTYTPLMVRIGTWWLLAPVWAVALTGAALKLVRPGRFDRLAIVLYLGLGWSGVVIYDKLATSLAPATLWLIGIGGFVYSLGVIFHLWERLRFQNAIWHGFVLVGAATHYAAVWSAMRMAG